MFCVSVTTTASVFPRWFLYFISLPPCGKCILMEHDFPEDLDQEGCGTSCLHQLPVVGAQEASEV